MIGIMFFIFFTNSLIHLVFWANLYAFIAMLCLFIGAGDEKCNQKLIS
jgi:hypothetical protein